MSGTPTLFPVPGLAALRERYFTPYYLEPQRERSALANARRDGFVQRFGEDFDWEAGRPFGSEGDAAVERQLDRMAAAARQDLGSLLGTTSFDGAFLDAFDAYWDRERVSGLCAKARPELPNNDLVVLVCELGAALGAMALERCPRARWWCELPYWESVVLERGCGIAFDPFALALHRFSHEGNLPERHPLSRSFEACVAALVG